MEFAFSNDSIDSFSWPGRPLSFVILSRLTIAFEREGRHQGRRFLRQSRQSHSKIILFELHRLAGRKHLCRRNFVHQVADDYSLAGPIMHVRVERLALAGEADVISASRLAVIGFANSRSVVPHPIADGG